MGVRLKYNYINVGVHTHHSVRIRVRVRFSEMGSAFSLFTNQWKQCLLLNVIRIYKRHTEVVACVVV